MIKYFLCILFSFSSVLLYAQNFIWAKNFASQSNLEPSINVDAAGNVYTIGSFLDSTDFDPGPGTLMLKSSGSLDVFVSKLDPNGNFVWAKKIGGTGLDCGYSLVFDAAGNIYFSGAFSSGSNFDVGASNYTLTTPGSYGNFICKLDINGNFEWAKGIAGGDINAPISLSVDTVGNLYATGGFLGSVDFDPGIGTFSLTSSASFDAFILKLDNTGNFVFAKSFGGSFWDSGNDIAIDSQSNIYVTGVFYYTVDFDPGPGVYNISCSDLGSNTFILKLNSIGNFVWAKNFKGDDLVSGQNEGSAICLDGSGNVYTTGHFTGNVDFDPGPASYLIADGQGFDAFISKLDQNGSFVWAKNIHGDSDDYGRGISLDNSGNVYTTGNFRATADFNPGVATYDLTSAGYEDVFISKFDASGNFIWAKSFGSSDFDRGAAITVAGNGDICVTGVFSNTVDFDPEPGVYNITANGYNDVFTLKLGSIFSTGIPEFASDSIQVYPTPSFDFVKIRTIRFVRMSLILSMTT